MKRILMATVGLLLAATIPAKASEWGDWTVVTVAQDGSWGAAIAGSAGPAIAGAIRNCRAMAGAASDCGAQFTAIQGGWTLAALCGDQKIVVAAKNLEETEEAAVHRIILKLLYAPDMPACRRLLTLSPHGEIVRGALRHADAR